MTVSKIRRTGVHDLAEKVCAVLVTRGDVDMRPILETLPYGEVLVWDNSKRRDYKLFGRYMGILETRQPLIYFQDDDCIVRNHEALLEAYEPGAVVGNFRRDKVRERYYSDTTLLGWGSLFDRSLPWLAWMRYALHYPLDRDFLLGLRAEFTWPVLTPSKKVLVDVAPGGDVEWLDQGGMIFGREDRMSNQPGFYEEIEETLRRAREVRDDAR